MGEPTNTSIPAISYYIRGQLGAINNLLFEDFYIDNTTYEILDGGGIEIDINAVAILKQIYRIYDYNLRIRSNMNSLTTDSILRVEDDGSSVQRTNRNEVSKTFASLKSSEESILKDLITAYKMKLSSPQSVTGDDTIVGTYGEKTISDIRTFAT